MVEAVRAQLELVPVARSERRPEFGPPLLAHVEHSGALGSQQPFMRRRCIEVRIDVANAHPREAWRMRAVDNESDAALTTPDRELLHRHQEAGRKVDV